MPASRNSAGNTTLSSDWATFNPYGDETGTADNTTSSSNSWPLDEIMDDIEQQMDQQSDAMGGMARQLEGIEVSLSDARTRHSKKKKKIPLSSSRHTLSYNKRNTYTSRGNCNDEGTSVCFGENVNRVSYTSSHQHSINQILQRTSELRREKSGDRARNTMPQDFFPPTHVQHSRRSIVRAELSSSRPRASKNRGNPKRIRSSSTWEESDSSNLSGPSDDVVSELGETTFYSDKSSGCLRSTKLKYFLAVLAAILVLLIGALTGQLVQRGNQQNSTSQFSPQQETEQLTNAEENASSIVKDVPENTPTVAFEDSVDDETEEMTVVGNAKEPPFEGTISSSALPVPKPTIAPTANEPIEVAPSTSGVVNQQNPNVSDLKHDYTANSDFLVGVYYYPWHGERFHNRDGYMRKELEPPHVPTLGEYNDSDPKVIGQHMKWFRQANIGLLVTSWWGPNRLEDSNTKDVIMQHEDIGNLNIAIHYETTSRLGAGKEKLPNAKTDIKYMCENYFDHPNYYKIDGRPVLFVYISRKLHEVGTLEEALLTMRSTASKCGHNIYLIGDSVFESAPDPNEPHVPFWYFDAVTNYDVYGSAGRPEGHVGMDGVDKYYRQQSQWKEQASRDECRYIPAVSPGYNDRGVRMQSDHPPLSRRIGSNTQEGSLFHYQLKQAKELVDPKVDNMILVNSFNEWHEDTQIEPVMGAPSSKPFNFTKGLEYVGYDELYLDILGAATSKDESRHSMFDYLFSGR